MSQEVKKNVIITGPMHIGKSTVVKKVLNGSGVSFQSIFTERILEGRNVVGYAICNEDRSISIPFAHENFPKINRLNRFGYKPDVFEEIGVQLCRRINPSTELFVIDEIGVMEQYSPNYLKEIFSLFDSAFPLLVVVQERATYLLERLSLRRDTAIFQVNRENRDSLPGVILSHIRFLLN